MNPTPCLQASNVVRCFDVERVVEWLLGSEHFPGGNDASRDYGMY